MRIGLVSTQRTSVPPRKTGSVELLVGLMADQLVRRGHNVTVFATRDSQVSARLLSVLDTGYHHDETVWEWQLAEVMQLGLAYQHAAEFDVIHSHVYCYALPFSRLVPTPTLHTFHICPTPDFIRFCAQYPEGHYVALSRFQRGLFGDAFRADVVPNGIDTASFPFSAGPGRYLAYLGDIRADKGPLACIRTARAAGVPILLGGPPTSYFHTEIKPHVDGRNVVYVGELDHASKVELLGGAIALMFPVTSLEACPLVLMESMACGTPVLAINSGPAPEIVQPGVGGICVDDVESMASQIDPVRRLDRQAVRDLAVQRFDLSRMVDDYLALYARIAGIPPS
jgi:glycosyltransferase involved in cell wall biosynthesis